MIGEQECGIKTCLKFELTKVPLALYVADRGVRKRDKSELGRYFRDRLQNVVLRDPSTVAVIDGGWLFYQVS